MLAEDSDDRERGGQGEDLGIGQGAEIAAHSRERGEERHEERRSRGDELLETVLAAIDEAAVVQLLEDEPCGEGSPDRCEADDVREPGKEEAEREPEGEQNPARAELGREVEQMRG